MTEPKKPTGDAPENTVERAYQHLLDRTVSFGYRPGERINEVELAASLGMSRAPVREALNRLIADGLVVMEPGRGFFCRKLSAKEIADLFAVRADLEVSAVRRACAGADSDAIAALAADWEQVLRDEASMSIEDLVTADEDFHIRLAALAGNAERLRYLSNINARIRFVRRINLEEPARRAASLSEHALILSAVKARDAETAARLVADHLAISSEEVLAHIHTGLARIYASEVA
ncbi:GntR family transcriptional regulator [Pararhizobium sp.]|uniref:GntR family transcriptional regulator n=1 Tax=Pararhizobium sp. TaxID=1977563 RepID=UPI00272881D8|nr:GntR family transcriptional regulator [Pararhizobium sp.]MDO9416419.1 GntR family transcriptional regulator [Pararhizobium sp.]